MPKTTIIFTGGGTGGATAPLLAVFERMRKEHPDFEFVFIGGKGVERQMANSVGLHFLSVPAGKLRRYWSVWNFFAPFLVFAGFLKSLFLLRKVKSGVVFGCGGFVQVPVMLAARFLRIPVVIHQQDVVSGLANLICAPFASRITVSLHGSLQDFSQGFWLSSFGKPDRVVWTGNPFRARILDLPTKEIALENLKLRKKYPTLLVTGGGTGAEFFNHLVGDNLQELIKYVNVVHLTGKGKSVEISSGPNEAEADKSYIQMEFTDDMPLLYAVSDLVLCRAGFSTITEMSVLSKPAIVIPLPGTQQERNASMLVESQSAVVIPQEQLNGDALIWAVRNLLHSPAMREIGDRIGGLMPKNATEKVAEVIIEVLKG